MSGAFKTNVQNAIAGLAIACSILIIVELPFRIYDYAIKYKSMLDKVQKNEEGVTFEKIHSYLFKTGKCVRDPYVFFRYVGVHGDYHFNALGIRTIDEGEPPLQKGTDTYRIIVCGGSHPFGLGVNYEETYSYRLQELFNKNQINRSKKVEVINAAVPGYSTLQVLNFLKYRLMSLDPDLLIIDAGVNDGIIIKSDSPLKEKELNVLMCSSLNFAERSSFFGISDLF